MKPPRISAPRWLPGGHAQTIWPKLFARLHHGAPPPLRRERWDTPDGDFVDCDWVDAAADEAPLLVLFHGLEGSSASHYCQAFASHAAQLGWALALPHFRGCSGELNRAPRAYHSGDFEEIGWMLAQAQARRPKAPLLAVGVSLGGNALLRWAQEQGEAASVKAIAAISAPLDLAAAGLAIHQGLNRQLYTRYFLRTMVPKALKKLDQHPGLPVLRARLTRAESLRAFDDCFTAPLHGFANADDYYARCSAGPRLHQIRVPALVLNARNDPFVPASHLPRIADVGRAPVTLWQPRHGGHVGFPSGRWPGSALGLPASICAWLSARL